MKQITTIIGLFLCALLLTAEARDEELRQAIVKMYTVHASPDYYNPWSMHGHRQSTGSGCIIKGNKILSNAHVVGDETFIQVRRNGEARRYTARVLNVSHDADLAVLTVDDPDFFEGIEPLEFGKLPSSQDEVVVYGFPMGGDTLSTTKGVISRIEHQTYAHSSAFLLAGQMDAAINPGNSGGPVLMSNRIVGVVMQAMRSADNIGYMVPVNIVQHFLEDVEDGSHDGFPSLGVVMQEMENPDMKRRYEMDEDQTGPLVIRVFPGSAAEGYIEEGDVILQVEDYDVEDDATIEFRPRERTKISYAIQQHQVGEELAMTLWRDGEEVQVEVPLTRAMDRDRLIPLEQYDVLPTYYIYGGVVFTPLTKNLMYAWGSGWFNSAPKHFVTMLSENYPREEIDEVVVVLKVLAADVNQGYHTFTNWIVETVNGEKVLSLQHLIKLIESSEDEYIILENESGQKMILDREKADAATPHIMETYRIPADRSEDVKQPAGEESIDD